jgi:hypothetical protein
MDAVRTMAIDSDVQRSIIRGWLGVDAMATIVVIGSNGLG